MMLGLIFINSPDLERREGKKFGHNADIWAITDQKNPGDFRCKKKTTQTWLWFEKGGGGQF